MALSPDQDKISRSVYGAAYAALSSGQKEDVDDAIARATAKVGQFAQHFDFGDASDGPSPWQDWAEIEAELILSRGVQPDRLSALRALRDDAMDAAFGSYVSRGVGASTGPSATITVASIRQHVVARGMRLRPRRPVDMLTIDNAIHDVINELWNRAAWPFRRRQVEMTIAANGDVSFDLPDGESFDSVAGDDFVYQEGSGRLSPADVVTMQALRARSDAADARPRWFRLEHRGSSFKWWLFPEPDAEYKLNGEVYIAGPDMPENATDAAWLDRFPHEFRPLIRDMAVVRVWPDLPEAERVEERINILSTRYVDLGNHDNDAAPRDIYNDSDHLMRDIRMWGDSDIGGAL